MLTSESPSAGTASSKLVLEHISKSFQTSSLNVQALDDVTLRIAEGEFVCLVGPSGCGKSTLLNIIAGLDRPDRGLVQADGHTIIGPGPHRLMMFPGSRALPWLTVLGNVLSG
jgi:NitT/TauT family transport system ATP-binding protein